MKILIVNSYDIYGGAARAAYRLHKSFLKNDIKSSMLVQRKYSEDPTVIEIKNENNSTNYNKLILNKYPKKSKILFSSENIPNKRLIEYINKSDADIVNLHWITNGFLSIKDLAKINKPLVWSLHDMWAFTGGCHYDEECSKYEEECNNCPVLKSEEKKDLSYNIFNIKKEIYKYLNNITIVGLSSWISNCSKESTLLKDKLTVNLPNTIDTDIFIKKDQILCREYFNLPKEKTLILFGAMSPTSDTRKGYNELIKALDLLLGEDIELVVFGGKQILELNHKFHIHNIPQIDNDSELVTLYNSANIMIVPSLQENLSNTIMESLSCSVPVVAFDIGGNKDMIEHKKNGYLAKAFDISDLAYGIKWMIKANKENSYLSNFAREKVLTTFSNDIVVPKYTHLFENILENNIPIYPKNFEEDGEKILIESLLQKNKKENKTFQFSKNYNIFFQKIEELNKTNYNYILYGNGTISKTIQKLIPDKIIGFVDIADENNHPSNLTNMKYDKILITVLGREEEIIKYLTNELTIDKRKIMTIEI